MARSELKTGLNASAEELQAANLRTIANIKGLTPPKGAICPAAWLVSWGQEELAAKLGLYKLDRENPAHADIPALFSWPPGKGAVEYAALNNDSNRGFNVENWRYLFRLALEDRFVLTGEPLIFDSSGDAASAQHRIAACFVATLVHPDRRFFFIVQDGIDPLLVDFIDTGKSRTQKDIGGRHKDNVFPPSVLRTGAGLPLGKGVLDARKSMIADATTACLRLWLRGQGKDVNATTSEWSKNKELYPTMLAKFPLMEWENPANGGEIVELSTLERATNIVYNYDREQGGTLQKYFGRGNLIAAIVMASNVDNPTVVGVEQHTVGTRTTPKVVTTMPPILGVDLDLANDFCRVACDKQGPFKTLYDYLDTRKGKNGLDPQYKFGAMVNTMLYFVENCGWVETPPITNEAGDIVVPAGKTPTCPPLPGNMVPNAPRAKTVNGVTKTPPLRYPHFGGFDVGYIDRDQVKAQAEIESVVEEVEAEAVPA